jgi:hypothetical protein
MKKVVIHTERITKPEEKFAFQLKVPKRSDQLVSIHVSVDFPFSPTNEDFDRDAHAGDIWLSVPSELGHFYTQVVRLTDVMSNRLAQVQSPGISMNSEQWFQTSEPRTLFNITTGDDDTLIEGFYESKVNWNYVLKIYLEFDE